MKNMNVKKMSLFALLLSLSITASAQAFVLKAATQGLKLCAYTTFTVLVLDTYVYPDTHREESSIESVINSCDKHYKKCKLFITTQPELSLIANAMLINATKSLETLKNTEIAHDVRKATVKVAQWLRDQRPTQPTQD